MGKHKRDKLGKAVRDNPINRPGGLGEQLHKDLVLDPDDQRQRKEKSKANEEDPEVLLCEPAIPRKALAGTCSASSWS